MSSLPAIPAPASPVLPVPAAIVRSPLAAACALAIGGLAAACGGAPADDGNAEILERLDRIDARLAAIEARDRETVAASAPHDDGARPAGTREPAPSLADPFARPDAPRAGKSLAIALTRAGWEVDGRIVSDAELEPLLEGVGSVTVRTDDGVPQTEVVRLLDLLRKADIRRVGIARFSDQSVTAGRIEPDRDATE